MSLQVTWFILLGVLFIGYAVLDGFDLGVGFWYLFTKREEERRMMLNAIGPVWDGNEVWLITAGGALFAAFPLVYAAAFSSMYLALMLVLFALILRAAGIEFRSQVESLAWRRFWDATFSLSSSLVAFLLGVALGNILRGLPLDHHGNYTGTFLGLLNPYALLVGFMTLAMFATHGALYAGFKTKGELARQALEWAQASWNASITLFVLITAWTWAAYPHLLGNFSDKPVLFLNPVAGLAALLAVQVMIKRGEAQNAFYSSAAGLVFLIVTAGVSLFPNLIPAPGNQGLSLNIVNASSSEKTLMTMLIIAMLGLPLVLGYTYLAHRAFKGPLTPEDLGHYY